MVWFRVKIGDAVVIETSSLDDTYFIPGRPPADGITRPPTLKQLVLAGRATFTMFVKKGELVSCPFCGVILDMVVSSGVITCKNCGREIPVEVR